MNSWFVCYNTPPTPKAGSTWNDWQQFNQLLLPLADRTGIPYTLLAAQAYQESQWKLNAYRYEPNYDRRYVTNAMTWTTNPAFLVGGPTADDWFRAHPARASERQAGVNYRFVAQTRIAASYGVFQVMYPTAVAVGFAGVPEDLYLPSSISVGVNFLSGLYQWAQTFLRHPVLPALKVALACYNGGKANNGNPAKLRNIDYVKLVNRRHEQLWGAPFFDDIPVV